MRKITVSSLLCVTVALISCTSRPKIRIENSTFVSQVNRHLDEPQKRYDCSARGFSYTVGTDGKASCSTTIDTNASNEAKRIRNDALEDVLGILDDNYTDFITDLETKRSRANFIADGLELIASGAVGITKGERPIQIIGVALTAFRGGRKSFDLNFFKEQTTPILINKMDDNRSKVQATIVQNMAKDIDAYSMRAAIRNIAEYYNAGTLIRAFTELAKDTAAQAQNSATAVEHLKGNYTIAELPSPEMIKESADLFAQVRSLARQVKNVQNVAAKDPAQEAAQTTKLRGIWDEIEKSGKFDSFIEEMKKETNYKPILDKNPENRQMAELLKLIDRLSLKVPRESTDLRKQLVDILKKANQ